jgi:hypothetical protein
MRAAPSSSQAALRTVRALADGIREDSADSREQLLVVRIGKEPRQLVVDRQVLRVVCRSPHASLSLLPLLRNAKKCR